MSRGEYSRTLVAVTVSLGDGALTRLSSVCGNDVLFIATSNGARLISLLHLFPPFCIADLYRVAQAKLWDQDFALAAVGRVEGLLTYDRIRADFSSE